MFKKLLAALGMLYATLSFAAVDANTGTATDLASVKGIGPTMSSRIIDERKKGKFKDWHGFISRVKGVGEKSTGQLSSNGLTINVSAYRGPAATETQKRTQKAPATAAPRP